MKKIVILLIAAIMLVMAGCQSKNISQNKSIIDSIQTDNSNANTTVQGNVTESSNNNSESTSSSKEQDSNAAAVNNTASGDDKKVQISNTQTVVKPKEEQKKPESSSFTLFISRNRGTEEILRKKVLIQDNKSLLDYLRDNITVVDDGGFIKSIEGLESISSMKLTSEQKKAGIMGVDWFLYQNEIKTRSGANDIVPKDGDIINIDYREWTYTDLAP